MTIGEGRNEDRPVNRELRLLAQLHYGPVQSPHLRGLIYGEGSSEPNQEIIGYIKRKIGENLSSERIINLFHCLNELNDSSLVQEVQQNLRSRRLTTESLSPAQWSALGFILLSSGQDLEMFDLKKYSASERVLLRLLPVVTACTKAVSLFTTTDRCRVRITADAAPIRLLISCSILPSLVNKTLRYLNSSTWGRISSLTRRRHSTFFRFRTMASDLEVLILIPTTSLSAAN
ncbi:hypothetical protein D4764_0108810 [Takifugu flavidus]|uniref:NACHT LRR and PYD domain-containing protein n=1 Tax=Takifugu flavidus TaxID=433684 RepID=A0A5C6MET1_9TELE|nr:hypothetical protein D4764_0108810 [Takifugu flavidus]